MRDIALIKSFVGADVTENELRNVDCYVTDKIGVFIPSLGPCGYAARAHHTHPSYMITIIFDDTDVPYNHYSASVTAPEVPHSDIDADYYCVFVNKEYFEHTYALYSDLPVGFSVKEFFICKDVMKALNTFAFEYTKQMKNSDITLNAQAVLLTHWIIRSILGTDMDMRAVSDSYPVARIQQYIETHYGEALTVEKLAAMAHMSVSSLRRAFQRELGMSPVKYITKIRIEKAKLLLRRVDIPLIEISGRCGLGSSAHFAQVFRSVTGITPTEYRRVYNK